MAGLIARTFINDLLARTDIVDVIGSRLTLKKTGKNYAACCPFHNEKTPSFTVNPAKQFYYCFGCGASGNALGFLMEHDHLDFPQAVEELARRAGMEIQYEESGEAGPARRTVESPLYALLETASRFYRQALKQHPLRGPAVDYLKKRGLTGSIARDFGLGFAPPGWDNLLRHCSTPPLAIAPKELLEAGLLVESADSGKCYDRFRDRIIFPIRDSRGRVIAFGGRVLGDERPKYLNSPETPIFHKGQALYGLYEARQQKNLEEIIVVEGYMDVIALAQQGLRNAVATLGTATSEEHVRHLLRITSSLVFCFDGDSAGRKAAWRALESTLPNLKDGCRVRFLFLPEGDDPDSLVRHEGPEVFRQRLQQAQPLTDYFFRHLGDEARPDSLEGKAHLAKLAFPLLEQIPGHNLKQLMQLRLTEITGLVTQPVPTTAPAAPPAAPPSRPAPPASRHSRPARQERTASPPAGNSVESPALTCLRVLLRRPGLARQVSQTHFLANSQDPQVQLLATLLDMLQREPELRTLQLLARWHGTEQGQQLQQLAEKEWLISDDNLEQQFFDTINRLAGRQRDQQLEQLLARARESTLSPPEKEQLRTLLQGGPVPAGTADKK